MIGFRVSSLMPGSYVCDLSLPSEALPFALVRGGRAFVPTPGTALEEGDVVHISVDRSAINKLEALLR